MNLVRKTKGKLYLYINGYEEALSLTTNFRKKIFELPFKTLKSSKCNGYILNRIISTNVYLHNVTILKISQSALLLKKHEHYREYWTLICRLLMWKRSLGSMWGVVY